MLRALKQNPLAPHPYGASSEDMVVRWGFRGEQGTLICAANDETSILRHYYSPKNMPAAYFLLRINTMDEDKFFGANTHLRGRSMYVNLRFGAAADIVCTHRLFHGKDRYDIGGVRGAQVWPELSREERLAVEAALRKGDSKLYSLPMDYSVGGAYVLPQGGQPLDGMIVFCSQVYLDGVAAYFVPRDASQRTQGIVFYEEEKRLSFRSITGMFRYGMAGLLSVSIDGGKKRGADFTGAKSIDPINTSGHGSICAVERPEIKALVKARRIPMVPVHPTPLITPFLHRVERGL